jgi:hypothetical protein
VGLPGRGEGGQFVGRLDGRRLGYPPRARARSQRRESHLSLGCSRRRRDREDFADRSLCLSEPVNYVRCRGGGDVDNDRDLVTLAEIEGRNAGCERLIVGLI